MSDIEKIHQEIDRLKNDYLNRSYTFIPATMQQLLESIDSLPEERLSEDLEEAAEEYAYKGIPEELKSKVKPIADQIIKSFIAGAKWIAKQGVSTIAISSAEDGITEEGMKLISDYLESLPDKTEVVLQIRKKQ